MIRRGIKNYFINLKHYFSPLGVFALGVVLGISVLIPGTIASVKALAESVTQATGGVRVEGVTAPVALRVLTPDGRTVRLVRFEADGLLPAAAMPRGVVIVTADGASLKLIR